MRASIVAASASALLCLVGAAAFGRGAPEEVAAGTAAFSRGDLEQAVSLFDRARRTAPDSTIPLLDFGIALYEKGDYAAALTAFQEIRSPSAGIEAEVHYDQGSALAQLGKQAEKDHPDQAIEFYGRGVAAYKRALEIDPGLTAAAANVEIVRQWIQKLKNNQSSNDQQNQQGQNPQGQNGQAQSAPGQGQQAPGGQSSAPGQNQPSTAQGNPTVTEGQTPPLDDSAESILQEERDRRQAEATPGGNTNDSPNW